MVYARSFRCGHCGIAVSLDAPGTTHRNHCPNCLWSRHLDKNAPGDRATKCTAGMEPIAVTVRGEGRWVVVHRCLDCGRLRLNKTAGDDNLLELMRLAALPLTMPPLPGLPSRHDESVVGASTADQHNRARGQSR